MNGRCAFLEHRIADKRILRLISKWLKVGTIKRVENERRNVSMSSFEWRELSKELSELHEIAYPGNQGDDDASRNGMGSLNLMGRS